MKTYAVILLLLFAFMVYMGCSKTSMKPTEDNGGNGNGCMPEYPDMKVTYNGYVKNILHTYCIRCHNGEGAAPGDFRTYRGVLAYTSAFDIRVLSDHADMPQGNAPLPKNIRDSLKAWIGNCTPER